MQADGGKAGAPWPDAEFGEVIGPSGIRCYSAGRAAEILGMTDRNVRLLSRKAGLVRDIAVGSGDRRVFLEAMSVEVEAATRGRWPPLHPLAPAPDDQAAWSELFTRQGSDLDEARRELQKARARIDALEDETRALKRQRQSDLRDKRDLGTAVASLGRVVERQVQINEGGALPDER